MADDYYSVLGVSRDASDDDIKKAYRRLVRKYHPDVAEDKDKAQAEMIKVNEAYGILSDPDKRAYYDQYGSAPGRGPGGGGADFGGFSGFGGFGDIFESFMNMGMGGSRGGRQPRRGRDIRVAVSITLEEAYTGCKKDIEFSVLENCSECRGKGSTEADGIKDCETCRGQGQIRRTINIGFGSIAQAMECPDCGGVGKKVVKPCKECKGRGKVKITKRREVTVPAGVETGNGLRLSGEGEAGAEGGPNGNVNIIIDVKDDKRFERDGADLLYRKKITFTEAALGADVEIEQVSGDPQTLKIPAGTQSGTVFRIRGKGMPDLRGYFGDMHVLVQVMVPTKLNKEQKKLLEEFAKAGSQEAKEPSKGFFEKLKEIKDAVFNS
ncbi:molecular chaperone DnaJ [bacterium]|nr:molecular chaperone DnaJ [bacterium]